jgi:hypothetical protein
MDIQTKSFQILPPAPGLCPSCGEDHEANEPHNRDSLLYQTLFCQANGRSPTWSDAIAHCPPDVQKLWADGLRLIANSGQLSPEALGELVEELATNTTKPPTSTADAYYQTFGAPNDYEMRPLVEGQQ